jgi:hypothetical protein
LEKPVFKTPENKRKKQKLYKLLILVFLSVPFCIILTIAGLKYVNNIFVTTPQTTKIAGASSMEIIENFNVGEYTVYYYRDILTDGMYMWCLDESGFAGMGGLTVMLDPETGLPLTYTRYMELAGGEKQIDGSAK